MTGRRRHRRPWRHSLGARLVLMFLLFAAAVAATFLIGMQSVFRGGWQGYAKPIAADYIDRLAAEIGTPPDLARAQAIVERVPLRIRIDGPLVHWDSQPGALVRPDWHSAEFGGDAPWRPSRQLADGHRITFLLADLSQERRTRSAGWVTLVVLLLLTLGAYVYVRHLLRPLRDIRAGAIRYGSGDFATPIAVRRRDELGVLAQQINAMAGELRDKLEAKRALLLAISHELRSPLTRARVNAELIEEGTERDALLRDLGQMRELITDLLDSERLAAGHEALHRERCDLAALLRELVASDFAGRGIALELDAALPPLQLDPARMRLLVRNLLDNALRHGRGAAVSLRTRLDGDRLYLVVRDHGPGVPAGQLERLAEAFYRADAARQHSGGVGLGLYLARLVAQAHGGRLVFRNAEPGLEAIFELPLAAAQPG
jgi:signal transduction histidine kinase